MQESFLPGLRLAIYARVSTEEQREGQTIDSQVSELERHARANAWMITGIYKDEGWSGALVARPQLDRLRDDARAGAFDAVLINDVDRLARDVTHLGVIKRDLERRGIRVIFRKLPAESSPTHNLMVNILGSFAEFEREMITDRTRRGRRHKVEVRKEYLGSRTAFGYRYILSDARTGRPGELHVDERQAAIVREMFRWVDELGLSARKVLLKLNELGIPTQQGLGKWGRSSVLRVLHNEMYTGVWHYNKNEAVEPAQLPTSARYRKTTKSLRRLRPRTEWLPLQLPDALVLVPRDRWQRVQDRLRQNIAFSPRNEKHFYLLKGLVWCKGCGSRYAGDPNRSLFFYRCVARCKRYPMVRDAALDLAVTTAIKSVLLNPNIIIEQIAKVRANAATRVAELRTQMEEDARHLDQLRRQEERVLDAYRTEIISPEQLGIELAKIRSQREAAQSRIDSSRSPEPNVGIPEVARSIADYCAEAAKRFANATQEQMRELLRAVIVKIEFDGSSASIQGQIPLTGPKGSRVAQPDNPEESSILGGGIAPTMVDRCGRNPNRKITFRLRAPAIRPSSPPQPRGPNGRFLSQGAYRSGD